MKPLSFYLISALTLLLAAGCASQKSGQGGAAPDTNTSSDYNSGAVHPGINLGTDPSEDDPNAPTSSETDTNNNSTELTPPPDSGATSPGPDSSIAPEGSTPTPPSAPENAAPDQASPQTPDEPSGALQSNPDETSPGSISPDQNDPQAQPPDSDNSDEAPSGSGPTSFRRTVLTLSI